ncbi:MAG: GAF domain-containing protein [Fimbriimonadaceae bacterium]|nr:GAF domain-containing protein [Fimbriimonadaceae bacterium]
MEATPSLLNAVHLATKKLSSSGNIDALLQDVLAICVEAVGAVGGTIYIHDPSNKRLKFQHVLPAEILHKLPTADIPDNYGAAGKVFQSRKTAITILDQRPSSQLSSFEEATGVKIESLITVPLTMADEEPLGVVQLINKREGSFDDVDASVLETISAVSSMAVLNHRLTDEATRASTLLGMGKVSHDIGNLAASLYANISFSDLAMEGLREHLAHQTEAEMAIMYAESLQSMLQELKDSVDRIVGYSRLISDLSVGRQLRPNKHLATLAQTIQTSAAYLESEGRKNHVGIIYDIQENAPATKHDELYIFRIVQNLVGNAVKAVKETVPDDWANQVGEDEDTLFGEVIVSYRFIDNMHRIEVRDTGPGMAKDVAETILRGTARSQWAKGSGSGWGTKIVLELAATHNAKVEIDSEPGRGTSFIISLPHDPGP